MTVRSGNDNVIELPYLGTLGNIPKLTAERPIMYNKEMNDLKEFRMKRMTMVLVGLLIMSCLLFSASTDVIPQEAFKMLKNPSTYIVDVRTIAEYVYVGHPEMALNIPLLFWNENDQKLELNENFVDDIKAKFKPEDTLILMCRSGGRSTRAMNLLKANGFEQVFNMKYGFEGEKDPQGYRSKNGWKNSGLPYTYSLNKDLIYKFK